MGLYSLIASTMLVKFFQETASIMIGAIATDTGIPNTTIQAGMALQSAGYALTSLALVVLNDLLGNMRTMRHSMLAILGATTTLACTSEPRAIYFGRFLLGVGMGGLNCAAYVQIRRTTPDSELGYILSIVYVALFSSAIVYSMIAGYFRCWRTFFVASAIVVFLLLQTMSSAEGEHRARTPTSHPTSNFDYIYHPTFVRCCLLTCLTIGHTYGLQSFASAYQAQVAEIHQGWLQSLGRIGMVLTAWLFGCLHAPLVRITSIGALTLGAGLLCMLIDCSLQTGTLLAIGFITSYCAIGITQTAMKTEMFLLLQTRASLAQGVMSGVGLMWDTVAGVMIWQLPWPYGLYVFVASTLALIVGVLLLARKAPPCIYQTS